MYELLILFVGMLLVGLLMYCVLSTPLRGLWARAWPRAGGDEPSPSAHITVFPQGHPCELRAAGVNIIGHIAGCSGAGKTTLASELAAAHPGICFKDIDEFADGYTRTHDNIDANLAAFWTHMSRSIAEFARDEPRPIIFVGCNSDSTHWLELPGVKWFLDPPLAAVIEQRYDRAVKLGQAPAGGEVVDWLKQNRADYAAYSTAGYSFANAPHIAESIRVMARNTAAKPQGTTVVWICGPSASGKTTLYGRLRDLHGAHVVDLDAVTDPILARDMPPTELNDQLLAAIHAVMGARVVVYVGFGPIIGLADYMFSLDTPTDTIFVRSQARELNTLCDNKQRVLDELYVDDSIAPRLNRLVHEIGHRKPVLNWYYNDTQNIGRTQRSLTADGFQQMSADAIYAAVSEIAAAHN